VILGLIITLLAAIAAVGSSLAAWLTYLGDKKLRNMHDKVTKIEESVNGNGIRSKGTKRKVLCRRYRN
jgi:hypothetical protein